VSEMLAARRLHQSTSTSLPPERGRVAAVVSGERKGAAGVRAWLVPGSAEARMEKMCYLVWRERGCVEAAKLLAAGDCARASAWRGESHQISAHGK
jgi:hypothetical protein